ncbi:uncharacterized protein LOC112460594 [Temnothorax curvispinosus]|uniref:Uncharacterized protein LOC112460594 n=1 Tax=Temnothorax curvispinosus TaxID=300111 RepID=A0A6J1QFJ3_9HYME|nr:uncharacterized protein LOC112460594 [Temnothorax curvispinosus]
MSQSERVDYSVCSSESHADDKQRQISRVYEQRCGRSNGVGEEETSKTTTRNPGTRLTDACEVYQLCSGESSRRREMERESRASETDNGDRRSDDGPPRSSTPKKRDTPGMSTEIAGAPPAPGDETPLEQLSFQQLRERLEAASETITARKRFLEHKLMLRETLEGVEQFVNGIPPGETYTREEYRRQMIDTRRVLQRIVDCNRFGGRMVRVMPDIRVPSDVRGEPDVAKVTVITTADWPLRADGTRKSFRLSLDFRGDQVSAEPTIIEGEAPPAWRPVWRIEDSGGEMVARDIRPTDPKDVAEPEVLVPRPGRVYVLSDSEASTEDGNKPHGDEPVPSTSGTLAPAKPEVPLPPTPSPHWISVGVNCVQVDVPPDRESEESEGETDGAEEVRVPKGQGKDLATCRKLMAVSQRGAAKSAQEKIRGQADDEDVARREKRRERDRKKRRRKEERQRVEKRRHSDASRAEKQDSEVIKRPTAKSTGSLRPCASAVRVAQSQEPKVVLRRLSEEAIRLLAGQMQAEGAIVPVEGTVEKPGPPGEATVAVTQSPGTHERGPTPTDELGVPTDLSALSEIVAMLEAELPEIPEMEVRAHEELEDHGSTVSFRSPEGSSGSETGEVEPRPT